MANIVITTDSERIYIAFNDYSDEAGMASGNWAKEDVSVEMNIGNTDIFLYTEGENLGRLSFNAGTDIMVVDTVDGAAPSSNADLKTKLDAALVITGGASTFISLSDVPNNYTGDALKVVRVNAGETALEFVALAGGGDMLSTNNLSDLANASTARTNLGVNTTANQSSSTNKNFVTDAQLTVIGNTSGTNTGDNATNTQYSGLAASKQDTLVSATNIKTVNGSSILGSGDLVVSSGYHFVGTLSGDQATGANVTPVTLTGLVFSYAANSKYRIWAMGRVAPTAATTGCGFQFDLSSAVTAINVQFSHQLANTGTLSGGHSIADDASVGVSSGMPGTSTYPITLNGLLVTGANTGTAQLRFRSETTAVTTCKDGFTLVIEKIA